MIFDMTPVRAKVRDIEKYLESCGVTGLEFVTDNDWKIKLERKERRR